MRGRRSAKGGRPSSSSDALTGRVAVVTGVSRRAGIGFAVCRRLLELGASVLAQSWTAHDARSYVALTHIAEGQCREEGAEEIEDLPVSLPPGSVGSQVGVLGRGAVVEELDDLIQPVRRELPVVADQGPAGHGHATFHR